MREREHFLSQLDEANRTAHCSTCGQVKVRRCGVQRNGDARWRCVTTRKNDPPQRHRPLPYHKHRELVCSRCGFVAQHACQMDVHHIDGNHKNNDPSNLTSLCANCHRLVHHHHRMKTRPQKRRRPV